MTEGRRTSEVTVEGGWRQIQERVRGNDDKRGDEYGSTPKRDS